MKTEQKQREATRRERRNTTVVADGKRQNVLEFLKVRAKSLPSVTDRQTGKDADHEANLRNIYMNHGQAGIDAYVNRVQAIYDRDRGATWRIRTRGVVMVWWYQMVGFSN